MNVFQLILLITVFFSIIIFLPDILPKCDCCSTYKPRMFIKIHKTVKITLGYKGVKSICKKCCKKYGLSDYDDYLKLLHSKKLAKIKMLNLLNIFHK